MEGDGSMKRVAAVSLTCLMLAAPAQASRAEPFSVPPAPLQKAPQKTWLRGIEPGTTGSIEGPATATSRPPCPPDRKIGTGAGFCMIN